MESLSEELVFFNSLLSLDCFKGKILTGMPHDLHGFPNKTAESAILKRTLSGVNSSLTFYFCAKVIQSSCSYSKIMYIYIYICMYVCTHMLYIYTYTVAQLCIYIYIIIYVCMYSYIIYIHIHSCTIMYIYCKSTSLQYE